MLLHACELQIEMHASITVEEVDGNGKSQRQKFLRSVELPLLFSEKCWYAWLETEKPFPNKFPLQQAFVWYDWWAVSTVKKFLETPLNLSLADGRGIFVFVFYSLFLHHLLVVGRPLVLFPLCDLYFFYSLFSAMRNVAYPANEASLSPCSDILYVIMCWQTGEPRSSLIVFGLDVRKNDQRSHSVLFMFDTASQSFWKCIAFYDIVKCCVSESCPLEKFQWEQITTAPADEPRQGAGSLIQSQVEMYFFSTTVKLSITCLHCKVAATVWTKMG